MRMNDNYLSYIARIKSLYEESTYNRIRNEFTDDDRVRSVKWS